MQVQNISSEYNPQNDEEREQNAMKKDQQKYAKNCAERIKYSHLHGTK